MNKEVSKLSEAKRLHDLGFGIHWIRPNSKVPVKPGWTDSERDPFVLLKKEYQSGYNIGTKLGTPSVVDEHFLAVIDVDVKGSEERHQKEARSWLQKNFGADFLANHPITLSGRGNGSMHVWLRVDEAHKSRRLYASPEEVEVYMPSVKATERMNEVLGEKKVSEGWRLRPAYEIDFMCDGRQVVLPPSIHPDSGKPYKWKRPIKDADSIPIVDIVPFLEAIPEKKSVGRPKGGTVSGKYELSEVEDSELEDRLSPEVCAGLYEGDGVNDRSAYCLTVALSMVKAKFTDAEILWVLTNRDFYLGDVAYEHAKTENRQRAARWANDYCLHKARCEADAAYIFDCEIKENVILSDEDAEAQYEEIVTPPEAIPWKSTLDRTDQDKIKPTLRNVVTILTNVIAEDIFTRDLFANRDFYGCDTPWGGRKGKALTDDDCIFIKSWLANNWKIEPNVNVIFEAMVQIASENAYHPVRKYLDSLEWDGVARLDTWMKEYLGAIAPEPYLSEISRKFLVAAVARVYEPGRKFDHMVILEGAQGIGKSSVGRILVGEKWFLDALPDLQDKDAALNLQGMWMIEMGELAAMKKAESEVMKAFVTRQVDKVRPPYGKRYIESYRQCVFFGTTNADTYLQDKSGNRRYWPVKVSATDFQALEADRDQLWAEAVYVYMNFDEELYLRDEVKSQAEQEQESRMIEDDGEVMVHDLDEWLQSVRKAKRSLEAKKGSQVGPITFMLKDLFDSFYSVKTKSGETLEGVTGSPFQSRKADNYNFQKASHALRKLNCQCVRVKGYRVWKAPF